MGKSDVELTAVHEEGYKRIGFYILIRPKWDFVIMSLKMIEQWLPIYKNEILIVLS